MLRTWASNIKKTYFGEIDDARELGRSLAEFTNGHLAKRVQVYGKGNWKLGMSSHMIYDTIT